MEVEHTIVNLSQLQLTTIGYSCEKRRTAGSQSAPDAAPGMQQLQAAWAQGCGLTRVHQPPSATLQLKLGQSLSAMRSAVQMSSSSQRVFTLSFDTSVRLCSARYIGSCTHLACFSFALPAAPLFFGDGNLKIGYSCTLGLR